MEEILAFFRGINAKTANVSVTHISTAIPSPVTIGGGAFQADAFQDDAFQVT
jgi:hypothetical protein